MTDTMTLKVSIFDNLSKIVQCFVEGPKNGYLVHDSVAICQEEMEATFADKNIKDHDKFALVAPDASKKVFKAVMW